MRSYYNRVLLLLFISGILTLGISYRQESKRDEKLNLNPKTSHISIISPKTGDIWYKGNTYDITWDSYGTSGHVTIELYQGGTTAVYWEMDITSFTDDDGLYSWTIPTTIVHQPNYIIAIRDEDDWSDVDYSGEFTITEEPDDDDDGACLRTYSWCLEGGEELIWEVTKVNATALENIYGSNWDDVNDDRYTIGAQKKRYIDRITAFDEYCNWRIYSDIWVWTTSAFTSTPDYDGQVETIYMDPASETLLDKELYPMDVVDYLKSSSAYSYYTVSNNKVTFESEGVKRIYIYDENSGVLSKFQDLDSNDKIAWEYELISDAPNCGATDGDDTNGGDTNGDGGDFSIVSYNILLIFGIISVFTSGIAVFIWRKSIK